MFEKMSEFMCSVLEFMFIVASIIFLLFSGCFFVWGIVQIIGGTL